MYTEAILKIFDPIFSKGTGTPGSCVTSPPPSNDEGAFLWASFAIAKLWRNVLGALKALRHSFAIGKEAQRKASSSMEGGGEVIHSSGVPVAKVFNLIPGFTKIYLCILDLELYCKQVF